MVLSRFESVENCLGIAHCFGEVMQLHWPWSADRIGSYCHIHAITGLSLINNVSVLTVSLLCKRRPVQFLVKPHFTFTHKLAFVCSTLGAPMLVPYNAGNLLISLKPVSFSSRNLLLGVSK